MRSATVTRYKKIAEAQTQLSGTFDAAGGTNYVSRDGNNFSDSGVALDGTGHTVYVFRDFDDTYSRLSLVNQGITAIALPSNEVLEQLFLQDNDLDAVPDSLDQCPNLKILTMQRNKIVDIAPIPEFCKSLTQIRLDNNLIETVPDSFGTLADLEQLYIPENIGITSIPASLGNLSNLTNLGFFKCSLSTLPDEIYSILTLERIFLASNQIISVSPLIGNLVNLTQLDLQNNQLAQLPIELGNCVNLDVLNIQQNPLTAIPDEIANIGALAQIYAGSSGLVTLPDLSGKTDLTILSFASADVTDLPSWVANHPGLFRIWFNKCMFTTATLDAALQLLYDNRATFTHGSPSLQLQDQRTGQKPTGTAGDPVTANTGEGWKTGLVAAGWSVNI